ncbi:MAG: hypothetical protein AAF772_07240 [Acidobacteriota bacterium]
MTPAHRTILKIATVLWIVWGLVHAFAGVMTISLETTAGFQGIVDGVDPAALAHDYHAAVGGVLNQHGWNLLWFGVATVIGGVMIWRGSRTAIWVTAMVGGLADLGYLLFLDVPGYVKFVPGTVMTLICGAAIALSGWVWFASRDAQ